MKRRLRVLTLVDRLGTSGGGERLAMQIAMRLDPARFESWYCASRWSEDASLAGADRRAVDDLRAAGVEALGLGRGSSAAVWSLGTAGAAPAAGAHRRAAFAQVRLERLGRAAGAAGARPRPGGPRAHLVLRGPAAAALPRPPADRAPERRLPGRVARGSPPDDPRRAHSTRSRDVRSERDRPPAAGRRRRACGASSASNRTRPWPGPSRCCGRRRGSTSWSARSPRRHGASRPAVAIAGEGPERGRLESSPPSSGSRTGCCCSATAATSRTSSPRATWPCRPLGSRAARSR